MGDAAENLDAGASSAGAAGAGAGTGAPAPTAAGAAGAAGAPPPTAGAAGTTDKPTPPAGTAGDADPDGAGSPSWPEKWREQLAGGDEKLAERLKRFTSPNDVFKAWLNADKRISEGLKPLPYPVDGTDEEKAAWRQVNEVPEVPEKYDLNLGDGLVLGDEDKPFVDSFLKSMHEANMPQSAVKSALRWYAQYQDEQTQELYNRDAAARDEGVVELRNEWGPEFKANQNAIRGWLDSVAEGLADRLFAARDQNGMLLGNDPNVLRWLASTARTLNPAATLIPGAATTSASGIEDEIKQIESEMRKGEKGPYWSDPKRQERYRQLLEARDKMAGKR